MAVMRMSVGEALVRFLDSQYVSFDGKENKLVERSEERRVGKEC